MARTQSHGNLLDSDTFVTPDTPIGLSIAGSDCCGGAGIQADLKTFTAFDVYGLTAVTAVVAETPNKIEEIEPLSAQLVETQVRILLESYSVGVIKTGMLPSSGQIERIALLVASWKRASPGAKLVVDPVIAASSADRLMDDEALRTMEECLLPLADLVTPNQSEAHALLGRSLDLDADPESTIRDLVQKFGAAVLLKGGHAGDRDPHRATDLLMTREGQLTEYSAPRIPNGHRLHGTGCTLSSAIAAGLAKGNDLEDAVAAAKAFITVSIEHAHHWPTLSALRTEAVGNR